MSLPNRIMTRRAFLKIAAQLPILMIGFKTMDVAGGKPLRSSRTDTAYGSGAYGQGSYGGSGYSTYLPLMTKEENEHGPFTCTR